MSAIDEKALRVVSLTHIDTLATFCPANDDLNDLLKNEAISKGCSGPKIKSKATEKHASRAWS